MGEPQQQQQTKKLLLVRTSKKRSNRSDTGGCDGLQGVRGGAVAFKIEPGMCIEDEAFHCVEPLGRVCCCRRWVTDSVCAQERGPRHPSSLANTEFSSVSDNSPPPRPQSQLHNLNRQPVTKTCISSCPPPYYSHATAAAAAARHARARASSSETSTSMRLQLACSACWLWTAPSNGRICWEFRSPA
jgi:hypothetical protein